MSRTSRTWMLFAAICLALANGCCVNRCGLTRGRAAPMGDECCEPSEGGGRRSGLLVHLHSKLRCGSGCGDLYIDEWLSDPPACCDPCNNWGQYVGPVDACRWQNYPLHAGNAWGTKAGYGHSGCASCSARAGGMTPGTWQMDEETVVDEQWSEEQVAPAPSSPPASAGTSRLVPSRSANR